MPPGYDMRGLVRITADLFDIADRLRGIDERYELYYNKLRSRFEIYADGALQIAVPFERLDARTLRLARETRVEYAERLLADIERRNAELEKAKHSAELEMLRAAAEV